MIYAMVMSSAQEDEYEFSSCLHVRKFIFGFLDRANARHEENRRFSEWHCGAAVAAALWSDDGCGTAEWR